MQMFIKMRLAAVIKQNATASANLAIKFNCILAHLVVIIPMQ